MKVADYMHKSVVSVAETDPVKKAVKIIFNLRISGIPVLKDKNLVGIITEEDILQKLFPSVRDFMEDYFHAADFDVMEKNLADLLAKPVKSIMTRNVRYVTPEAPLLKAQSMMILSGFSRIPVVNDEKKLVGIISQGDIFRAIAGTEIPFDDSEEYHDWLSRHFDQVVSWGERRKNEIPSLTSVFKKLKVSKIVDIGCGTGEHAIALAKENYEIVGVEASRLMYQASKRKYDELSSPLQKKLSFIKDDYIKFLDHNKNKFDAAIFMGNAIAHIPDLWPQVLASASKSLRGKNAAIMIQVANFNKIFKVKNRFLRYTIAPSKLSDRHEYGFLTFYDPPREGHKHATLTMSVHTFDGKRWSQSAINSTPIALVTKDLLKTNFNKLGFKNISFYGSKYWGKLFKEKFDPVEHDWLNVVAQR